MTTRLMQVAIDEKNSVIVEVDVNEPGFKPAGRKDAITKAAEKLEEGFDDIVRAARKALDAFQGGDLDPDEIELSFGVKINGEVGAVISKLGAEGHFAVRVMWTKPKS